MSRTGVASRSLAWSAFALALAIGVAGLLSPPDAPRFERFLGKARLALNQGEFDRARTFYRFALTFDGTDAATIVAYETASMLHRLDSTAEPLRAEWLRNARKRRPDDPYVALYAAETARRAGRIEDARGLYSRALSLEPGLDYARERLAALDRE